MSRLRSILFVVAALLVGVFGLIRSEVLAGAPSIETRAPTPSKAQFSAKAIVAITDADMAGTAYADGKLRRLPGQADELIVVSPNVEASGGQRSVPTSNSVMGWPGSLDLSSDARFAYVVENRAPAPAGVDRYKSIFNDMPPGNLLSVIALNKADGPRAFATVDIGGSPASVHVAPNGQWLAIGTRDPASPLVLVTLNKGRPDKVIRVQLDLPKVAQRPIDEGVLFARINPAGNTIAMNIANTHIAFASIAFDSSGAPTGASLVGEPVWPDGKWLTMLRWANDGRHVLVSDVGWGATARSFLFNGPGAIISIAFDANGAHRQVSKASVSLSPEAFDLSPTGDLIATVNMERSYLSFGLPYSIFGRRNGSSLSLVTFDAESGALKTVDGPIALDGVLPEDVVAVYHERSPAPKAGWIELLAIDRTQSAPQLRPLGQRLTMPRGVHDLAVIR
jgi:hypothetical protein